MMNIFSRAAGAAIFSALLFSSSALADGRPTYHVTITNLTNAVMFTPILVASQRRAVPIFELGAPASKELTAIAEGGDISGLKAMLEADPHVVDVQDSGGLLMPGASVSVIVSARHGAKRISLASMMLPTNDGFIALDSVKAPRHGSRTYFSPGYDGGTEPNDEWCMHIPGPFCEGAGPSPGENPADEGYVHIHRGIHGIGDLKSSVYDWRNPVARITVTRIRHKR